MTDLAPYRRSDGFGHRNASLWWKRPYRACGDNLTPYRMKVER